MSKSNNRETTEKKGKNKELPGIGIVKIFSHLISLPVFIILHKTLPDPDWPFHLDRILLFIGTILAVEVFFYLLKTIIFIGFILAVFYLTYGTISGNYGFKELYNDYQHMLYSMVENPHPEEIIISNFKVFPNKNEIKNAIDFENPEVRNFAITAATAHFKEYQRDPELRTIVQCLSVFKTINSQWSYVSDPKSREYFAKASESKVHLAGDCDDHSILMAACIKSIGGTARLIHTVGHLYPELLIGTRSDLESVNYLIKRKLFQNEMKADKTIFYHIDEYGQIWLNLDYTKSYPGGPFMNEKILGVLTLH